MSSFEQRARIGTEQFDELAPVAADAKERRAEQRLADKHPERGGPECDFDGEHLEDQAGYRRRQAAAQHQQDQTQLESVRFLAEAQRDNQRAGDDQGAARDLP
jgi:hypothetical protein